ncbi:InlB B-repeat-containing protein [Lachnospiraceae bacterium LCP19S3_B12]
MKKRILSIVLTLCMVLMLVPATVFAEGGTTPTYDLWQVDGKVYYAEAGTRTDFSTADGGVELPDWINPECYQFPSSGTYVLQTDITLTSSRRMIQFTTPDTTLELNGKTVTCYGAGFSYISAENVTILDSVGEGTINGEVSFSDNCSLTLKSGTIYALNISGNSTFYADGGKIETVNEAYHATITQNNGTAGTEFNGFVNLKVGTFSGGVFYGLVGSGGGGGPFSCTISGGVFYGEVENKAKSTISDGVFYGTVVSGCGSNSCTISGGVFYGEVENKANSTISGGVFYGGIEDNGGTITDPYHTVSFDLNGASGTAPVTQYFVNTNTAQALEPAAPTREGYEFAGWYNGETKYDFTQNVTENITLKAKWESAKSPAFTGLEDGKTYCDTVQFEVSDNVGVASVTAGGVELSPTNGKYTLEKGIGTVTVVAIDKANNQTSVTVTVNNGHTAGDDDGDCSTPVYCIYHPDTVMVAAKSHNFSGEWNKDEDGHWHICQNAGCTVPELKASHSGTDDADCTTEVVCECGYTITAAKSQHSYGEWQSNGNGTHTRRCTVTGCNGYEDGNCTGGTATCTSKAICEYCKTEYGEFDSSNHNLEKIPAKDATVTATGNKEYWHCKDCKKYFSDAAGTNEIKLDDTIISKLSPEIIEGKGQSITAGEQKELTFKSNAAFSDFIRVELDGKNLDEKYYTVKEGSTVVTLKADYVATLSAGEHTIGIVSTNGTATTTFTVNAKAVVDNDTKSPQTGDNSHMALWIALLFMSGAGVIGTTVYGKKKRAK